MKRNDISRNCFFETIPWMIVLIILFIIDVIIDVIIGIIDWFPASLLIVLIWESLYMKYRQDAIIRIIEKERKDGDIEGIR